MGGNAGPMAVESRPANSYLSSHVIWVFLSLLITGFLSVLAGTAGRARAWSVSVVHAAVILFVVVFVAACRRPSELNYSTSFYLLVRFVSLFWATFNLV